MSEQVTTETTYMEIGDAKRLVNEVLTAHGVKNIPYQMIYNHSKGKVNKGERPVIKWTPEHGIDRDSLEEWATKYLQRKLGAQSRGTSQHAPLNIQVEVPQVVDEDEDVEFEVDEDAEQEFEDEQV